MELAYTVLAAGNTVIVLIAGAILSLAVIGGAMAVKVFTPPTPPSDSDWHI